MRSFAILAMVLSAGCGGVSVLMHDGADDAVRAGTLPASYLPAAPPGEDSFIGARAGFLFPDQTDVAPAFMMGAFYPGSLPGFWVFDTIPFETGLDFAFSPDATFMLLYFDCLFGKWGAVSPVPDIYGVGGYQIITAAGDFKTETVSAIDLGVGAAWPEQGWDARLTLSILLGSDNVGTFVLLTGGYRF